MVTNPPDRLSLNLDPRNKGRLSRVLLESVSQLLKAMCKPNQQKQEPKGERELVVQEEAAESRAQVNPGQGGTAVLFPAAPGANFGSQ